MKISLKKSWNIIAEEYQKKFFPKNFKYDYLDLNLLGNVRDKKILDLGCGGGQNSILLAKKSAKVTGVDFSEKQINLARELAKKQNVKVNFIIKNIKDLSNFSNNEFDIVMSDYTLQYVKNLDKMFSEVNRIIKKNGIFLFCFDHPMQIGKWFSIPEFFDLYVIENYFKRRKLYWKWKFKSGKVSASFYRFHRTIQDIFDLLIKNKFVVERLIEPEPIKKEEIEIKGYEYRKCKKIPFTIVFKARKK